MFDRETHEMPNVMTMPLAWHQVREHFLGVLDEAQRHRGEMQDLIRMGHETVPVWHAFELKKMLEAVNQEREKRKLQPVDMDAIVKVNQFATGHSDYSRKFALYCAELGVGQEPEP